MVLVEYPDTDSDGDNIGHDSEPEAPDAIVGSRPLKRKQTGDEVSSDGFKKAKMPALPPAFHSLYATNVRGSTKDDPSLHGGRQRQTPHIQGNWPSHIYLDWFPLKNELARLDEIIVKAQLGFESEEKSQCKPVIHSSLRSSLGVQLPLHVSLSAPLTVQTPAKDNFIVQLRAAFDARGIVCFNVVPNGLAWVANFDGSRFFLVLRLTRPERNQFNELLAACNGVCHDFRLPVLYQTKTTVDSAKSKLLSGTPSTNVSDLSGDQTHAFHISIAWTLDKPSEKTRRNVETIDLGVLKQQCIEFDEVRIKVGNVVTAYNLPSPQ